MISEPPTDWGSEEPSVYMVYLDDLLLITELKFELYQHLLHSPPPLAADVICERSLSGHVVNRVRLSQYLCVLRL